MKKISIFCIVLLIVGLLGSQAIGTEGNPTTKDKKNVFMQTKTEKETKPVQVAKSEPKETEAKPKTKKKEIEAKKQIKTVTVRLEDGYKHSLNNIENFKNELREEKVKLILVYNGEEFAKGYIGLNSKRDGLKYIYLPHTKHLENPEYVRQYNKVRKTIYNLRY